MIYYVLMNKRKVLLLVAGATFVSVGNVLACKCATETQEFSYAAKNVPLIFAGQLVSITYGANGAYSPIRVYKFVPSKIWRGAKADTITLVSGHDNCDVTLNKGRYVIYTYPAQDLAGCDRIRGGRTETVESEIRKLDQVFHRKRFRRLQAAG